MSNYQHILLALDYSPEGKVVAKKAQQLAKQHQATLSLLHVLDNIAMPDTAYGTVIDLAGPSDSPELTIEKKNFTVLADQLAVSPDRRWLVWGNPKQEIVNLAERQHADLIVIGSHGRHGWALLLGSTANAVLHHAHCDVMAVRITES
jgi:universal stress protein A